MQPRWIGYRAASKLHRDKFAASAGRPAPENAWTAHRPLIVSDFRSEVLRDLAREVAAERERAVHASIGLNGVSGDNTLLADSQLIDYLAIAVGIALLQIIEQTATLAHEHEKSSARSVVLLVGLEMLRQLADALT